MKKMNNECICDREDNRTDNDSKGEEEIWIQEENDKEEFTQDK